MAATKYEQFVTAPVVLTSVSALLGTNIKDLATLCKSSAINKWAIYKPQSPTIHRTIDMLTLEERQKDNMGLNFNSIPELVDEGAGISYATIDEVRTSIAEWEYKSRTQPYRLHDFLNDTMPTSNGYNHNAKPCDDGWSDSSVRKMSSVPDILVSNFDMRFGEASADVINNPDTNCMPIKYICSEDTLKTWYLGLAIYIEKAIYMESVGYIGGWLFVRGLKPLNYTYETNYVARNLLPNLTKNEWLRSLIQEALDDNTTEFTYVPCILKNPIDKVISEEAQRSYISMSGGDIICMPSGAKDYKLTFVIPIQNRTISNTSGNIWYIIDGTYYVQFSDTVKGIVKYMIKSTNDTLTGRTLSGWWLVEVQRQTDSDGFAIKGFLIVFATVDKDSDTFTLAKPTLSSQNLTITNLTISYQYLKIDSNKSATTQTGEASLQGVTMDVDNPVQYKCSNFSAEIYGCDVSDIILGTTSSLYEAGLTVKHVLNPSIT